MRIIGQLGLIFLFGLFGEILARYVPLAMPASVWGLLLLLAALRLRVVKTELLGETAEFLGANMAFFFLPAAVMVVRNYDLLEPVLLRLMIVCFISTGLTFLASYYAVRFVRKIIARN